MLLEIKKINQLSNVRIDLSSDCTVIGGINTCGKTTCLDMLSTMITAYNYSYGELAYMWFELLIEIKKVEYLLYVDGGAQNEGITPEYKRFVDMKSDLQNQTTCEGAYQSVHNLRDVLVGEVRSQFPNINTDIPSSTSIFLKEHIIELKQDIVSIEQFANIIRNMFFQIMSYSTDTLASDLDRWKFMSDDSIMELHVDGTSVSKYVNSGMLEVSGCANPSKKVKCNYFKTSYPHRTELDSGHSFNVFNTRHMTTQNSPRIFISLEVTDILNYIESIIPDTDQDYLASSYGMKKKKYATDSYWSCYLQIYL